MPVSQTLAGTLSGAFVGCNADTAVGTSSTTLFTVGLDGPGLYRVQVIVRFRATSGTGYNTITLACTQANLTEAMGSWTRSRRNQTVDTGAVYSSSNLVTSRGSSIGDVHALEFSGHVVASAGGDLTFSAQLDAGGGFVLPGSFARVTPETSATTTYGYANKISITSGNGYAGSVITSTNAGQWKADGTNISGQTGTTYIVTRDVEGKAITCGSSSNAIQMWTPMHLPTAFQTDGTNFGGWWDPSYAATVTLGNSGTTVASIANGFTGGPAMAQANASVQPPYNSGSGGYLDFAGVALKGLQATNLVGVHMLTVLQYKTGVETTFSAQNYVWGNSGAIRMLTQSGQSVIFEAANALFAFASINAGLPTHYILPLPLSLFEFWGSSYTPKTIGPYAPDNVSWHGPMREMIALCKPPSTGIQERLQGYMAWHNGVQASLPPDHTYFSAPPRVS